MKKNKEFLMMFLGITLFVSLANFYVYYYQKDNFTGDLGRLGKINFGKKYVNSFVSDFEQQKYFFDGSFIKSNFDVITIGDSFSQQKKIGYQNYLGKISNKKIMNLKRYNNGMDEPEQTAFLLLNSGYFDIVKPKYLIVESVGREFLNRGTNIDVEKKDDLEKILNYYKELKQSTNEKKSLFDIGNLKFIINPLLYKLNDRAFMSVVYKKKLLKNLFTVKNNELYFYIDDIKNLKYQKNENFEKTNKNLNLLSQKLKEKGITLVVMPAVDKYDLYQDYIIANNFPKNTLFENYELLDKEYLFINTKKILLTEIIKGEKDVFYANDTHWSHKASEKIAQNINTLIF